jgi:hypothetical protein
VSFFINPGKPLLVALCLGYLGYDCINDAVRHDHPVENTLLGLAFLVPAVVLGFYSIRWILRGWKAFFS